MYLHKLIMLNEMYRSVEIFSRIVVFQDYCNSLYLKIIEFPIFDRTKKKLMNHCELTPFDVIFFFLNLAFERSSNVCSGANVRINSLQPICI